MDEAQRQRALDNLRILDTPSDERVDRVTRLAQEIFAVPMVSVTLVDRDRQWRKSQIGLGGNEAQREDSFCDATVRLNDVLIVEDASVTQQFRHNPFVVDDPHLRFYAGYPLRAPGGEPIGTLCLMDTVVRSFDEVDRGLLQELALWVQTQLARDEDLDHATVVQRSFAPRSAPRLEGWTICADSRARGELSGDFYDLTVRDDVMRFTVADVMGKGTGPAIIASAVRASLRTAPDRGLAESLAEVDALLDRDLGDKTMFVTAVHADLDTKTGRLRLVDAGHSLAFIRRASGEWEHLVSAGLPLGMGVEFGSDRDTVETTLEVGDMVLCCSDGLLDLVDPDEPLLHVNRVVEERGPEGAVAEAMRLSGHRAATDDVTALIIRRDG